MAPCVVGARAAITFVLATRVTRTSVARCCFPQLARHTSNPESASRPRVGVSRSLDAEVARRDRAQLLSSGAAGAKPAAGRETGRRTPPSPASSCSPKSRDGGRIVEGSVPAVRDKGDVGAQEPVPSPRGDAGDDGGRRDAPAQPSPRSPADSLFDRPGGTCCGSPRRDVRVCAGTQPHFVLCVYRVCVSTPFVVPRHAPAPRVSIVCQLCAGELAGQQLTVLVCVCPCW